MITLKELLKRTKTEKIVVHTPTEDQAKTLLKKLDEKGYEWFYGEKLTDMAYYEDYKEKTCYTFYNSYGKLLDKKIMYGLLKVNQDEGYTIIDFNDIDFKENA